ncbi:hypothetical protein ACFPN7_18095 [Amycolatopsis halotolerans]|uniref:hypothetical protein n=1 Tax=Amycolatopsis halotolerans TaxID=330083 RepID=UPI003623E9D9
MTGSVTTSPVESAMARCGPRRRCCSRAGLPTGPRCLPVRLADEAGLPTTRLGDRSTLATTRLGDRPALATGRAGDRSRRRLSASATVRVGDCPRRRLSALAERFARSAAPFRR